MKTKTLRPINLMNRSSCPLALLLIPLALAYLALSPQASATCEEGCLTNSNTVLGEDALLSNTGANNTAIGFDALSSNTIGSDNTATGSSSLRLNTTGDNNTATGHFALFNNTSGDSNTAIGSNALLTNTTGFNNTANGFDALKGNSSGVANTASGADALSSNTTGLDNTANGTVALFKNTIGSNNTANGSQALLDNTTGDNNTAHGANALLNNTTGDNNIALGESAGLNLTTGKNNIDIGNAGVAGESNKIRIGTTGIQKAVFIAGINGVTVSSGVGVIINTDGKLGTVVSSERFKDGIQQMNKASEAIFALKPVTFRYKHELDPEGIPQFGLVAEEVEKVNPDLVARDERGKPYTVRYEAVNAMLLNEFLKEHKAFVAEQRKVQEQGATIARLEQQIEALTAGLQKVSAQLEASKLAPQVVVTNQ
jgi:Chaperone of endosialidase